MILIEETTVPASTLPVTEFREHLRLGSGFTDDGLQDAVLERFIRAAMAAIEARTGKIMIERSFSWSLNRWSGRSEQPLPVAPVNSIDAILIRERTGVEQSVDVTSCCLKSDAQRPSVESRSGPLPTIPFGGSVKIQFVAGFASAWGQLPIELAQATMLLAAHYYEYRHEAALGGSKMPYGVSALIERHRSVRLSARGNN